MHILVILSSANSLIKDPMMQRDFLLSLFVNINDRLGKPILKRERRREAKWQKSQRQTTRPIA
jgi:hypothetical protein